MYDKRWHRGLMLTFAAKNPGFVKVALEFPEEVFLAAEIIRMLPSCVAPYVLGGRFSDETRD